MQGSNDISGSKRRKVIPTDGYDNWYRYDVKSDMYSTSPSDGSASGTFSHDVDSEREQRRKELKGLFWDFVWAATKEGLGILGYGALQAASAATGAVIGAAGDVYDIYSYPFKQVTKAKDFIEAFPTRDQLRSGRPAYNEQYWRNH